MLNLSQYLSLFFLIKLLTLITILIKPTKCKTNNYLLNCGAQTTTTNNQTWHTDEDPTFAPLSAYKAATKGAPTTQQDPDAIDQAPCTAARTFHAPFTYSFPVSHGPKFVRLHFCAYGTYDNIDRDHFYLSVQANGGVGPFTLLHNFSAYLHQQQFEHTYSGPIGKEFLVMATTSRLNLTFSPTSDGYLGFVNGIEIVDVPDGLYNYLIPQSVEDSGIASTGRSTICQRPHYANNPAVTYSLLGPTALETVSRLNVGGTSISPEHDSGGVSRTWYKDDDSLLQGGFVGAIPNRKPMKIHYNASSVPVYTAPDTVYWTARVMGPYNDTFKTRQNLTWQFTVDSGFDYLVRLHLCEIDKQVKRSGQREFDVLINEQLAQVGVDVMCLTLNRRGTPVCNDYVASIYDGSGGGGQTLSTKVPLRLTLRPTTETHPLYHDVLLNGLEIFKMNQSNGNLAGPNPTPLPDNLDQSNTPAARRSSSKGLVHLLTIKIVAGVLSSLVLISIILAFAFRRWMSVPSSIESKQLLSSNNSGSSTTIGCTSSLPTHLCHCFSLQQIKVATRNFTDDFVIGGGGFGKVYKASIAMDDGTEVMVAIKRLNPSSKQGAHEFHTEIEMLTALRHVHLVSLIGYCHENGEMILVYDYMPLGTLQDHLYQKSNKTNNNDMINNNNTNNNYAPMPWKQRLMTCIGAARGLHYLHTGATRVIIHRDVKSSNILLDKNWVAKVSDFGISKIGPCSEEGAPLYISTLVKGSIGYLDPEYLRLKQLTHKSDVYSFGVVLFEVLCGRPVMVPSLPNEQVNLAMYAKRCYKEDTLDEIVDPHVKAEIATECLSKFGEIANKCVRDNGTERPSMEEVVWYLEFALQLQQTSDDNNNKATNKTPSLIHSIIENEEGNATIGSEFISSTEFMLSSSQTGSGTVLLPHSSSDLDA